MRVTLQVIRGPETGRKLNFRPDQLVKVGRTDWADVALPYDSQISGMHFSIEIDHGRCQLTDLKSRNGTYVNDDRVTVAELKDGDYVLVGETCLQVSTFATTRVTPSSELTPRQVEGNHDPVNESENETPAAEAPPSEVVPAEVLNSSSQKKQDEPPPPTPGRNAFARKQTMVGRPPAFTPFSGLPENYATGLTDEDSLVRDAALECAVWNRDGWVLRYCRRIAAKPELKRFSELKWLAVLGDASDITRVLAIGRNDALGPCRFSVLGTFGHPDVVPDLLIAMDSEDAKAADAAHQAFRKITGQQFESDDVALIAESEDEFDQEFAEEVIRPDAVAARQYWDSHVSRFASGQRWCGGNDLSDLQAITESQLSQLDMGSIRELIARARFYAVSDASRADLDRFPFQIRLKRRT